MSVRQRLWLCLPPIAACWADVGMTLASQSGTYWSGDFAAVDEFNPLAWLLLRFHPAAFVAAAALWCATLGAFFLSAKSEWRGALLPAVSLGVTFCHAVAAAAWLARPLTAGGIVGAVVVLVVAERFVAIAWRKAGVGEARGSASA